MPLPCANPRLKCMVVALKTVKAGVLDTTLYTANHGGCSALQGHGTRAAISFNKHTEAGKGERQAKRPGAGGSLFLLLWILLGVGALGTVEGKKMALEKRVVGGGNEVLAGKIQKALHIWALSRAMPAKQPQSSTGDDSRRFK